MRFVIFLFPLLFLTLAVFADEGKPNVIVILADDLGVMDTSLRDPLFYETPALEKLASEGVRFLNGYCAHPRCVPSRYALQTGRFPARDSLNSGPTGPAMAKRKTIAQAFRSQGYATFFAGKWHLGKEESEWPHEVGYNVNIGGCHAGAPGSYFFPWHITRPAGKESSYGPLYQLEKGKPDEHITERLTRETEKWVERQVKKEQPFFAFLSHYAVHTPIEGKPDEVEAFTEKLEKIDRDSGPAYLARDGQTKQYRDDPRYASMIKTMDESVGQVLAFVERLGIRENTIIAFTSDHGGLSNRGTESNRGVATSNEPFRAGKGHLYEGGLRVPFLISWPGKLEAGKELETVAVGTDLYPTLLDLAGLELFPKAHASGTSLAPALRGEEFTREKPLIFHSPLPRPTQTGDSAASAIRVGDWKLIKTYFPESLELYHLKDDPYERNNLADEKAEKAETMKARLEANLIRWGAMPPRKDWKKKDVTAPLSSKSKGSEPRSDEEKP